MHEVRLISAHCENFKGFMQFDVQFGEKMTKISGCNGLGKSTVAEMVMWTLHGIGNDLTSNPKVRREVDGAPINDVPVTCELAMMVDGKEVVVKKVQKRSIKKDGSFSDDNTYSINGVEKTLRDFNGYFDFSFSDLLMCMNIGVFMAKKPKEMREFLFKLPENISDNDIISEFSEFADLVGLSEKYSVEEIAAMNKASIVKLNKEISGYPGRIDEVSRQIVENVDLAEMELQKNDLQRQIKEIEKQEDDSLAHSRELDIMSTDIMELQFKRSEIERRVNVDLIEKKKSIQSKIDAAAGLFRENMNAQSMAEMDKQRIENAIVRKQAEKDNLLAEYQKLAAATYQDYMPLPQINENDLFCPTCGQNLPEDLRAQKLSEYEEMSRKHKEKYEREKAQWEKDREEKLADINKKGKSLRNEIANLVEVELPAVEKRIDLAMEFKIRANSEKNKAAEELRTLPEKIDLSDNQEYEALCFEINAKEEAIRSINTGADYRATLRAKKVEIQAELDAVKNQISKVFKNAELEERLEFLRLERMQKEQKKADCEKILDLLDDLDKKKNELLVERINDYFGGRVTWDLFAYAKNGGYKKDYCVPRIDGYSINDNTANHGRVIEAMMIIALSVQKIVGIQAPIILDDGESLDPWRLPKCENQLIVMNRTDDTSLKVEVS